MQWDVIAWGENRPFGAARLHRVKPIANDRAVSRPALHSVQPSANQRPLVPNSFCRVQLLEQTRPDATAKPRVLRVRLAPATAPRRQSYRFIAPPNRPLL